jgi:hypoxanthine phosphoribosyltransferase
MDDIITWDDFINLCDTLYDQLALKNFDGVITIGRGGAVVGSILASQLGTRLHSIFVDHKGTGDAKTTEIVELGITPDLPTGRYLLVDDQCYSGDTFDLVESALPELRLETAAIICHDARYQPDYYAVDTDQEIMFPYEAS